MKVLKICTNTWKNASRDKRELSVCRELGAETVVMAKGEAGDDYRQDEVDGFPVYRFSTRPLGTANWLNIPNRALSLFVWGAKARRFHADVISGHDIGGLFIGYLATLGQHPRARLVYDSHEFELGRAGGRGAAATWFVKHLERFLMERCAFSIMVNDTIADEVQRIHRLQKRPVVVRNIPDNWELDAAAAAAVRREILSALHAPGDAFVVMYHGALVPNRGIEQMLQAVAQLPDVRAVVLGNGAPAYVDGLRRLCSQLSIAERVYFHAAVPISELKNYIGAVDVGMAAVVAVCKSYYYSLPNKFFECIQSLTPVIVSDFPTVGDLVDKYGIGLRVPPEDPAAIADAIRRLRDDKALYARCRENLLRAKDELCWEREKEVLKAAYREILT